MAAPMQADASMTWDRNWPMEEKIRSLPGLPVARSGLPRRNTIVGAAEDHGTALGRR